MRWPSLGSSPLRRRITSPLTFDLPESLIAGIEMRKKAHGLNTASEVVRAALEQFDFETATLNRDEHRQISLRVTRDQRAKLKRYSKRKKSSVGELLRLAIEALPERPRRK